MIHLLLPKLDTQLSPSLCKVVAASARSVAFSAAQALPRVSPTARETPSCQARLTSRWSPLKRSGCCNCQTQFVKVRTLWVFARKPSWRTKGEIFLWGGSCRHEPMDEMGSGAKTDTSAARLGATGGARWSSATAPLSSAPLDLFGSGHTTSLFKTCLSFSSSHYAVAVCLRPLRALTRKQFRSAYQSRCYTLPFSYFKWVVKICKPKEATFTLLTLSPTVHVFILRWL